MAVNNKKSVLEVRVEESKPGNSTLSPCQFVKQKVMCAFYLGKKVGPELYIFPFKYIAKKTSEIIARSTTRRAGAMICSLVFMMPSTFSSAAPADVSGKGTLDKSHRSATFKKTNDTGNTPDVPKDSRSCLTSLAEAEEQHALDKTSFVDVRLPEEYARYRIAGSINIPLHMVRTKEFLKTTPVMLVNDGRCTAELENTCRELRRFGFKSLSVLDGGLFAWHASQKPLEGDPIAVSRLGHMSAEELFEVRALANWAVIDISASGKNNDILSWLPTNIVTVPPGSTTSVVSTIQQLRKKNPQGKILIIANGEDAYQRVDAQLKKAGIASGVLYLDGGINGYRVHIKNQLALLKQQNQPRRYEACRG